MKTFSFTAEVVTPLFMGGANPIEPEFRESSLKGALRWWFRALWGAKLFSDPDLNNTAVLAALHGKESEIFGSTDAKGTFSLRIIPQAVNTQAAVTPLPYVRNTHTPYVGYGLGAVGGRNARKYIPEGTKYTVFFTFNKTSDEKEKIVFTALWLLSTFGNLGSKSTRGFGSVCFSPNQPAPGFLDYPQSINTVEMSGKLSELYGDGAFTIGTPAEAPFSILGNSKFHFKVGPANTDAVQCIRTFSDRLRKFRENPNDRTARGICHTEDFKVVRGEEKIPKDTIFGLPHNFRFSDRTTAEFSVSNPEIDRRTSPLRLKVLKIGTSFFPILVLFEADFLPEGATLSVGGRKVTKPGYDRAIDFINTYTF